MMGGQGCCKHARETRGMMLLDEYKKGSLKVKKDMSIFFIVEMVAVCVEGRACKNL
jgi:hypothetical protein